MRATLTPQQRVLELRIHGIKNTPPSEMLDVALSDVVADHADDLGGFWTAASSDAPPEVRREAYSWGALARSGGGALAFVGQLFVHIGWFLVLPFGLANLAYWTRSIPEQKDPGDWHGGPGSAYLRWFALGLTLLYVVAVATATLDVIGVQCYRAVGVCSQLPMVFDSIAGLPRAGRLGILALMPLALVLLLWVISHRARMRFEPSIDQLTDSMAKPCGGPVLSSPAFWSKARVKEGTERLHVAASAFTLAALLVWDHLFVPVVACRAAATFVSAGCLAPGGPLWRFPWSAAGLVLALVGLVVAVVLTGPGSPGFGATARRRWSLWVLVSSLAVLVATVLVTVFDDPDRERIRAPFVGLVQVPVSLVGILLVIAIGALGWRRGVPRTLTATLTVLAICVPASRYLLAPVFDLGTRYPQIYVAAAGVVVLAQLVVVWIAPRRAGIETTTVGWRGAGPGIVMILALGIAMVFSTMLVGGVSTWLSQPPLGERYRGGGLGRTPPDMIELPGVYADFAFWVIIAVLVATVVFLIVMTRQLRGFPMLSTPAIAGASDTLFPTAAYAGARPAIVGFPVPPPPRTLSTRRMSALLQRGEPALGVLAMLLGLALALTAAPEVTDAMSTIVNSVAPVVALGVIAAAAAVALSVIATNALTTKERPLGLLWDLICFLPRAGHPFAPPCYAERVVPELDARIRAWLAPHGEVSTREISRRSVVLSAHSLGAVLAVSSLFALRNDPLIASDRLGLVTYGCQLRPYFGRFFPELFGPAILGTAPCLAPSLLDRDPWFRQVAEDEKSAADGHRTAAVGTLLHRLTAQSRRPRGVDALPAWINLWRRTDYLGFPAMGYAANPIDRGASELDRRTYLPAIATHSHYPLAPQYDMALAEVVSRMGGPVIGSPSRSSSP